MRAPLRRPDRLFHYVVLAAALTVVVLLLLIPLLTGTSPRSPVSMAASTFERPFREAFAKLFFWLHLLKWISAGIFVMVVAAALVMRVRTRHEVRPTDETSDLGDRP